MIDWHKKVEINGNKLHIRYVGKEFVVAYEEKSERECLFFISGESIIGGSIAANITDAE